MQLISLACDYITHKLELFRGLTVTLHKTMFLFVFVRVCESHASLSPLAAEL